MTRGGLAPLATPLGPPWRGSGLDLDVILVPTTQCYQLSAILKRPHPMILSSPPHANGSALLVSLQPLASRKTVTLLFLQDGSELKNPALGDKLQKLLLRISVCVKAAPQTPTR